ncbi:MAG: transglycosylase SLT domain-containing protein [Bdellovibrionota bacterium]
MRFAFSSAISRLSASRFVIASALGLTAIAISPRAALADDSAGTAFRQSAAELQAGKLAEALKDAERAANDHSLRPWAEVLRGKALEKLERYSEAAEVYRSVNEESAASLDARTALVRLRLREPSAKLGSELSRLEDDLSSAERYDLIDELNLAKAGAAEDRGDRETALNFYQSVRKRRGGIGVGATARDSVWRLQRELELRAQPSVSERIAETTQLLKEHEGARALEQVRKAKQQAQKGSAQLFELMLLEDQALREFGSSAEANKVLESVVSQGEPAFASQALTRLLKNAWNKSEDDEVLSRIAEFRSRFGQQNSSEVAYIEARTVEHKGDKERAAALYRKLAESSGALEFRIKALRQLAWTAYRARDYSLAAHYFEQGAALTKQEMSAVASKTLETYASKTGFSSDAEASARGRVKSARDLLDDKLHFAYWLGDALGKIGADRRKADVTATPAMLWQQVHDEAPFSYYGGLAGKRLGKAPPPLPRTSECLQPVRKELIETLSALRAADLVDSAEAEINWQLMRPLTSSERAALGQPLSGFKQFKPEQLSFLLTRAKLFLTYAHPNRGVVLADQIFKRPSALRPFAFDASDCMPTLRALAFPVPAEKTFRERGLQNGVSPALMLAIARTESLFDPKARSGKDARGLMQLLVATARQEGMPESGNLFDPEVNITYAAKHLARLLGKFQNNPALVAAAYNAGAAATEKWMAETSPDNIEAFVESITYPETRDYVKKVMLAKQVYEGILADSASSRTRE